MDCGVKIGKTVSRSITKRHVEDLGDGNTIVVEEKSVEYKNYELRSRLELETKQEYTEELKSTENEKLDKQPCKIILENKYLEWKLGMISESCSKFCQSFRKDKDITRIFHNVNRSEGYYDIGFLVMFDWGECMEYGKLLYDHTDVKFEYDKSEDFLNDFISGRFIDKLIFTNFQAMEFSIIWPKCMSSIRSIKSVSWCNHSIAVTDHMSFAFGFERELPANVRGFCFKPPILYFPTDLMLLLPEYKKIFHVELEYCRNIMLSKADNNPAFQNILNTKLKQLSL